MKKPSTMTPEERLFIGLFPGGIVYADRAIEQHGDYKKVAFMAYSSLEFEVYAPRSPLLELARKHATEIQAKRGQQLVVSGCGQTVLLGSR
jgi:hypothetical protein